MLTVRYMKTQKETQLWLERLNDDAVCKNSVMIERNEATGIQMCELHIPDNMKATGETYKQAKSHVSKSAWDEA